MLYFENDYAEGAHEKVLNALLKTNNEKHSGYGRDAYSLKAKEKIKKMCGRDDIDIYFLTGGTQTNLIVIGSLLKSYEGVIAVETGHVNVHEAGAVELTGHKVLTLPQHNGKININELKKYIEIFYNNKNKEHMVYPGMVYISHPTEYGTLYTKKELKEISEICRKYEMPLFLDGARLGYGLVVENTDVDLPFLTEICDVFYIGGTKVGALCGETVVFTKNNTPKNFTTIIKQYGALLAKGRLLGIQFDTLFTDGLYLKISRNAIETAEILKRGLKEKGYRFYIDSPTNQQFIILKNEKIKALEKEVIFSFWKKYDENHTIVRFVTSWSTSKKDVEKLIKLL
ncbi:low specificity L-threonine aldolase [Leptotrichia sp. OH3620_COT-345]|uniref:threonine aldolase family protein n=1 Tax=Leptotrichia sp. OH3620_COT-345 TaxID=2491048 RepID=UPI000F64ED54|nr:low specificity L-threonine aldolase [Leptotrichia sp. OH3620_COT-345]RRD40068.1 low specificity L-threonine aldolase [Leptotrichia sp. OH3620_COT-345]